MAITFHRHFIYHDGSPSYTLLLVSLLLVILVYPFLESFPVAAYLLNGLLLLVLITSLHALHLHRMTLLAPVLLVLVIFAGRIYLGFYYSYPMTVLVLAASALFSLYVTVMLLRALLKSSSVTTNTIIGAVAIYLMIGLAWAYLFALAEVFYPGSLMLNNRVLYLQTFARPDFELLVYYSFVCLTTLGFGDMLPHTAPMRALSFIETVVGQIYLTVLVARFVGLHIIRRE